ncbi:hypothetical protein AB0M50_08640 [Nonomuraea fuscirosea]|uniref:hypothetical protein n=1 Tax=Nonomuraea fuscirosea TaxID=1291556 RepID=UPI002DDA3A5A|nr:hypothetical protein [Nonomuraea fuscirosea]WSA52857.1 hypothetical protein OIE67_54210 [Nonomuraea fuscirosea]
MRLFTCATVAALTLSVLAVPAEAASSAYGWAWSNGKGHLRIVPKSATRVTRQGNVLHRLKAVSGAKELRLDYTGAAYGRVTVKCDLKETEGHVALDSKGLGRTRCGAGQLATELGRGPVPVRVEHRGGKAVKVNEILLAEWPGQRSARGTIKRVDDTTVLFATGGKTLKLGYSYVTGFSRTTAGCGDGWLSGRPVNADRNGLGKKPCTWTDLTKALKTVRHPVLVKIEYTPGADSLDQVWEIFGDA